MVAFLTHLFGTGRRIDNDLKFLFGILSFKCGNKCSVCILPPNTTLSLLPSSFSTTREGKPCWWYPSWSGHIAWQRLTRREHAGLSTSCVLHNTLVHCGSVLMLNYFPAACGAAFVHESSVTCRDCVHALLAVDKMLPLFSTSINFCGLGRPQKVTR